MSMSRKHYGINSTTQQPMQIITVIYPFAGMEKTNKELRAITLQYQVGRTFALVMKKADNTLTHLFTLRVTQVLHHRQSGVPILLECERCVGYTSIGRAATP